MAAAAGAPTEPPPLPALQSAHHVEAANVVLNQDLETAIYRALSKRRTSRFEDAAAMRARLVEILSNIRGSGPLVDSLDASVPEDPGAGEEKPPGEWRRGRAGVRESLCGSWAGSGSCCSPRNNTNESPPEPSCAFPEQNE